MEAVESKPPGRPHGRFFLLWRPGGDELDSSGRPKILAHKNYFDPEQEPFENERDAYAPLVWQCRYGGVEVPDALWQYGLIGEGKEYSAMQAEHMVQEDRFMQQFDAWTDAFARFVEQKGKVPPNKYRAYGFKAPGHFKANIQDGIRYVRMMIGRAPAGSSPKVQDDLGLNQDATLYTRKGEGDKLRGK
jgi:hypothetical protein